MNEPTMTELLSTNPWFAVATEMPAELLTAEEIAFLMEAEESEWGSPW